MRIMWAMNPLETRVELDELDKLILREQLRDDCSYEHVDEQWLSERTAEYVQDLLDKHVGDCTCVPSSCSKCYAESLLDIDTIAGLGKHSAYKIDAAFANGASIDEAVQRLENYQPKYTLNPSWPKEDWEKHVPRWVEEAKRAHAWLVKYRDEHFSTGAQ